MRRKKEVVVLGRGARQDHGLELTLEERLVAKDKEARDAMGELLEVRDRVWRLWVERAALEQEAEHQREVRAGVQEALKAAEAAAQGETEAREREELLRREVEAIVVDSEGLEAVVAALASVEEEREALLTSRAEAIVAGRESRVSELQRELEQLSGRAAALSEEHGQLELEYAAAVERKAALTAEADQVAADAQRLAAEAAEHRARALVLPDEARRAADEERARVRRLLEAGPPKPQPELLVFGAQPQVPDQSGFVHLPDSYVITPRGELVRVE